MIMKKLMVIASIFISSLVFGGSNDTTGLFPCDSASLLVMKDSILYHSDSQYRDADEQRCPYWWQQPWVFVRYSPTPLQIAQGWQLSGVRWRFGYNPNLPYSTPGTLAIWNTGASPISAGNLKLLAVFWKSVNGPATPVQILIDNGWKFTLTQDFWIGYTGMVNNPAGYDSILPLTDITSPAAANRNYYSLTGGKYGVQTLYSDYDYVITAYIMTNMSTEENAILEAGDLTPESNVVMKGHKIKFLYKIPVESTLRLYGMDGRVIYSQTLPAGRMGVALGNNLPAGVYFYRVSAEKKGFAGKVVVL